MGVASRMLINVVLPYQVLLQGRQKENKELRKLHTINRDLKQVALTVSRVCIRPRTGCIIKQQETGEVENERRSKAPNSMISKNNGNTKHMYGATNLS